MGLTNSYADGTATVDGLGIEFFQCSDYGDGIQMRTKNGKVSSFWTTTAIENGIGSVVLTYNTPKTTKDIADCLTVEFSNNADFSEIGETIKVSYVNGTAEYTVTPTGSYKYVRFTHSCSNSLYWTSVVIEEK